MSDNASLAPHSLRIHSAMTYFLFWIHACIRYIARLAPQSNTTTTMIRFGRATLPRRRGASQ
eukprot:2077858-Pyramimonas_sp.AAC.1